MTVLNLTGDVLRIGPITFQADGEPPVVIYRWKLVGSMYVDGVDLPVWRHLPDEVTGLPNPADGTMIIVAEDVARCAYWRGDLHVPVMEFPGSPLADGTYTPTYAGVATYATGHSDSSTR